jgi:hypothetical protein
MGNWNCFGVALRNKDLRVKKMRGNEIVEMHTTAS